MIDLRHTQRNFGDGFIHETVDELWEEWMRPDRVLEEETWLATVHEAL